MQIFYLVRGPNKIRKNSFKLKLYIDDGVNLLYC
jgi:hypothetical protein